MPNCAKLSSTGPIAPNVFVLPIESSRLSEAHPSITASRGAAVLNSQAIRKALTIIYLKANVLSFTKAKEVVA
jgi:hypothetical protein